MLDKAKLKGVILADQSGKETLELIGAEEDGADIADLVRVAAQDYSVTILSGELRAGKKADLIVPGAGKLGDISRITKDLFTAFLQGIVGESFQDSLEDG